MILCFVSYRYYVFCTTQSVKKFQSSRWFCHHQMSHFIVIGCKSSAENPEINHYHTILLIIAYNRKLTLQHEPGHRHCRPAKALQLARCLVQAVVRKQFRPESFLDRESFSFSLPLSEADLIDYASLSRVLPESDLLALSMHLKWKE